MTSAGTEASNLRLGAPAWTSAALPKPRTGATHPGVRGEVGVERTVPLRDGIAAGRYDLVVLWDPAARSRIASVPMAWLGPCAGFIRDGSGPLPLVEA